MSSNFDPTPDPTPNPRDPRRFDPNHPIELPGPTSPAPIRRLSQRWRETLSLAPSLTVYEASYAFLPDYTPDGEIAVQVFHFSQHPAATAQDVVDRFVVVTVHSTSPRNLPSPSPSYAYPHAETSGDAVRNWVAQSEAEYECNLTPPYHTPSPDPIVNAALRAIHEDVLMLIYNLAAGRFIAVDYAPDSPTTPPTTPSP